MTTGYEPYDKLYRIRHFDSNLGCEDYINANCEHYEPISISDTNAYITVLLKSRTVIR
jgi:hypothetical protein